MDYGAVDLSGNAIKGFIDPTSFAFSPQTADRSYQVMNSGLNPNPSGNGVPANSFPNDQGAPVFTHGDIKADGNLYIGGHVSTMGNALVSGNMSTIGNNVTGQSSITTTLYVQKTTAFGQNTYTQSGSSTITIDCSLGNFFQVTINSSTNFSINASNVITGQPVYIMYANTGNYNPLITMGNNIHELVSGTAQSLQIYGNLNSTQHFIGFSGFLGEIARMTINST